MRTKRGLGLVAVLVALAYPFASTAQEAGSTRTRNLIVGTKVVKPFAFKDAEGRWTGISIDLWEEIARRQGYEYELREARNTNELVDLVAAGELDVGIAAITMKPSRARRVDFSNSMYKSGLGIAVRAQAPSALSMLLVLFTGDFLKAIAGLAMVLFLVGLVMWGLERRANSEEFEEDPRRGLWSGFWWSAVTMTTVGYGDKAPRSVGGRLVGLVWMYTSIILISSFTAVIASSLTTRQLSSRISGEEDLYDARVGAKAGESPMEILGNRGVRAIAFDSIPEGLEALAAGDIDAFVHDQPVLRYEILGNRDWGTALQVLVKPIREEEYGIAVRPTAESVRNVLREEINATLLEIKIAGRLSEIESNYIGN
jgi:ABC-type amino acid transport substrate-binding protein